MYSQNGWKVDRSAIAQYTIPGTSVRINLRKGDASVVLLWLAGEYARLVEPLTQADTGGFVIKGIEGGRSLSNHASGTAMDLRWNKHPMWVRGTFSAEQRATIQHLLSMLDGVVRWGGNYVSRADEMHFEVVASAAKLKAVADKIRAGTLGKATPLKYPPYPGHVLKRGMTNNNDVRAFQAKMQARGWRRMKPDGDFGPVTEDLVRQFQREKKLTVDGLVGPKTWKAIFTAPK